jgi:hypothetical protein
MTRSWLISGLGALAVASLASTQPRAQPSGEARSLIYECTHGAWYRGFYDPGTDRVVLDDWVGQHHLMRRLSAPGTPRYVDGALEFQRGEANTARIGDRFDPARALHCTEHP